MKPSERLPRISESVGAPCRSDVIVEILDELWAAVFPAPAACTEEWNRPSAQLARIREAAVHVRRFIHSAPELPVPDDYMGELLDAIKGAP
jgi:hypothetical protein